MKKYKLFLWLLFFTLFLNGCEDLELDSSVENQVSTEMNSGVVMKSAGDLNRVESSSSGENFKITEVGNILDLPETSLPGKAHSWYLPISFYSGRLGKISVGSLAGYPYWNANSIGGIYVYGSPSAGEMMYYNGQDFVFTAMPSCLLTKRGSNIHLNNGRMGIGTTKFPLAMLEASGSTEGVYGSGSNYGVRGSDSDDRSHGHLGFGDYGVHGMGSGVGVYGLSSARAVEGNGVIYDFYASGSGTNYGPFTGGHEVKLSKDFLKDLDIRPGMLVSVTGETQLREGDSETTSLSSTLPTVQLSDYENDKRVFGVFTKIVPLSEDHWFHDKIKPGDRFATVNSLGEGRVLVTNLNGEIEAGDYITTSNVPGYGMKQDDDLLHNYTLGKAIEDVDWTQVKEVVEYNGKKYKIYLISVVYTSG
jgi:hypothetical protein